MFDISGTAPIVPFLPVYARQLGFSGMIVGMIYTVLPITGMLAKPLFGAIADRYRLQKTLFLAFQIVTAISFFVIQFIPEIQTESAQAVLACDADTYFRFCSNNIDNCAAAGLVASNDTTTCEVCMLCSALHMISYLMFMGPCIVIIWYIIPTRCTSHRVYLI
jgi:MFS family permease